MTSAHFYDTRIVPGWQHTLQGQPKLSELRREVSSALAPQLSEPALDDLLLVLTELISNTYRHTHAPRQAQVLVTDAGVLVEVSDGDSADLRLRPPSPVRTGGRGLILVGALAEDWGVESTQDREGKTVWALLPRVA
ncbi:MAG: ATP-binding protein [Kibdelosporangium sp.]